MTAAPRMQRIVVLYRLLNQPNDPPDITMPYRQVSVFDAVLGGPSTHIVGAAPGPGIALRNWLSCSAGQPSSVQGCLTAPGVVNELASVIDEASGGTERRPGV